MDHKGYVKMARQQGVQIKKRDENGECVGAPRLVKPSDSDKAIVQAINSHYFAATASRNVDESINKQQTNKNRVIEREDYSVDERGLLRCIKHTDKKLYAKNEAYVITPQGTCDCKSFQNTLTECKHIYWARVYFPAYFEQKHPYTVTLP